MAVAPRHLARQHGADGAMHVADLARDAHRLAGVERRLRRLDQAVVHRPVEVVVLRLAVVDRHAARRLHLVQDARQIDAPRLPLVDRAPGVQLVDAPDHVGEAAEAELGHQRAHLLGDEEEVVDHVLRRAGEALAQHRVLRGDADRAGVQVALAHHDAAGGDQRRGGEAELVGAEQRAHHHVAPGAQAAIDLHRDAPAQRVEHQCLLRLGQPDLPRRAGMGQRGQRAGAGAALEAGDRHVIGARLGDAGGDGADADLGNKFHRDARFGIGVLQIVNELRQVLDRVDVVVRRRRDQPDARRRIPHPGDVLVDLAAGQLATLAGLGALCHLDLQVVGVDQVFRGDAEPPRCHLLDRRAHRIAVRQPLVAVGFLAALAGVRLAADAVHRDRQRGVRLARDRAEAHRAGGETLDDLRRRLDLLDRHRLFGEAQLHQAANGQQPLALVVDVAREGGVVLGRVAARGVLQAGNGLRRPGMRLAAQAEGVVAADIQHAAIDRVLAMGGAMAGHRLLGDLGEADALDRRRGAGEAGLDERAGQADRVEDLRAAIGLVGGDAHLGHHLQYPLADRLVVVLLHLGGLQRQAVLHADLFQRFEGDIGIDRLGAVAGQGAEMMHLAWLAAFHHQADLVAQALADQVVVHRGGGEQGGDRDAIGRHRAIRQHQDVVVGQHRVGDLAADAFHRALHADRALRGRPGGVDRAGAERAAGQRIDRADLLQIGVGQDRVRHFQPVVRAGLMAQQVRPRTDHRDQRHHQLLADRIDRRVGDLGEVLLEVVVEQLGLGREHRERRVGAHRAHRIIAVARHRLQEELQVLLRVAEHLLLAQQGLKVIRPRQRAAVRAVRQFLEFELRGLQPLGVRVRVGQRALDLGIIDDTALFQVDQQHLAGPQPPFADDLLLRHRQHTGLGGEDHVVVVGNDVARRAQPVAVQGGTDLPPVGEGDRRRPVPGFHQRGVIFVERAPLRPHQLVAGPGLRDQQHHRVRQRVAAGDEDLQRVVDARGVGLAVRDDRPHLGEVRPDQVRRHRAPPGIHPVDVAAQGVDLAVVRQEAVRMRQLPGREGVGGEALVHQRQRRFRQWIAQIEIEAADLRRQQQSLVDHGAGRERRHVQIAEPRQVPLALDRAHVVEDLLADRQDLPFERGLILDPRAGGDDRLADHRHRFDDAFAETAQVDRHVAPADQGLALGDDHRLEMADGELARGFLLRQEAHRDGVAPGRRQLQRHLVRPVAQQAIGHLDQAAGTIAHQRVGPDRAAMVEIDQDLQAATDDLVRLAALDIGHEADPARIVFVAWIVQSLALRKSHRRSLFTCRRRRDCPAGCHPPLVEHAKPWPDPRSGPAGPPTHETIRRPAALQQAPLAGLDHLAPSRVHVGSNIFASGTAP